MTSEDDGCVLVRRTLCEALGNLIQCYETSFKEITKEQMEKKSKAELKNSALIAKLKGLRKKSWDVEFTPGNSQYSHFS